jgi:hypothetical protein
MVPRKRNLSADRFRIYCTPSFKETCNAGNKFPNAGGFFAKVLSLDAGFYL